MLKANTAAPPFSSVDQHDQTVRLEDFAGRYVVLYFYPKDDTPGCTIQANDFTARAEEFDALNASVVGVSKDDCASHQAFIDKFSLNLVLLADTSGDLCETYQVWREKERDGKKSMGIVRSTFVVDPQGQLIFLEYGVDPNGHADKILHFLNEQK